MALNRVTLKDVVKEFMLSIDVDDYTNGASEAIVKNYALRGIRDMGFDMGKIIKSTTIDVSATNTADLPADFVNIVKMGLVTDEGKVIVFAKDNNITKEPSSGLTTVDPDSYHDDFVFRNFIHNGEHGVLYGIGGGYRPGYYKLNMSESRIEFDSSMNHDKVAIEYIADEALAAEPTVHVFAEEALRSYIYYKLVERKSNVPMGEKQRARSEYYNERRKANSRMQSFSKEDVYQVIRKNFKQSTKV